MNDESLRDAAEHALAASMKEFQARVTACGRDLQSQAISLTWRQVADEVFKYLCEQGINPLELPKEDLESLLDEVDESLDTAVGDGALWTTLLFPITMSAIQKAARPVEIDFPNSRGYASDHSSETADMLAHPHDCRCPKCEGESPEESRLQQIEDSHLEAEYEDRVSGCDWDI